MDSAALTIATVVDALQLLSIEQTRDLVVHLGFEVEVLDDIERRYDGENRKVRYIQKWVESDINASWEKLIFGLKNIKMNDLARDIESKLVPQAEFPACTSSSASAIVFVHDIAQEQFPPSTPSSVVVHVEQPLPGRVAIVKSHIKKIKIQFNDLQCHTETLLFRKERESPGFFDILCHHLLDLPVAKGAIHAKLFEDDKDAVRESSNISGLFHILRRYCNYSNYEIILHIVKKFCEIIIKAKMLDYQKELKRFEMNTTVDIYLRAISTSPRGDVCRAFSQMTMKLNKPASMCTLHEIRLLKESIAENASVHLYSMHIESITESSVTLRIHSSCVELVTSATTFINVAVVSVMKSTDQKGATPTSYPRHHIASIRADMVKTGTRRIDDGPAAIEGDSNLQFVIPATVDLKKPRLASFPQMYHNPTTAASECTLDENVDCGIEGSEISIHNVVDTLQPLSIEQTRDLMFHLGLEVEVLNDIEKCHDGEDQKLYFVQKLLESDKKASWKELISALRAIKMYALARDIKSKYVPVTISEWATASGNGSGTTDIEDGPDVTRREDDDPLQGAYSAAFSLLDGKQPTEAVISQIDQLKKSTKKIPSRSQQFKMHIKKLRELQRIVLQAAEGGYLDIMHQVLPVLKRLQHRVKTTPQIQGLKFYEGRGKSLIWKKQFYTPLMYACEAGHIEMVKFLLSEGANPHYIGGRIGWHHGRKTGSGLGAMHVACIQGRVEVVQLIIKYSVNQKTKNRWTPLMYAVKEGHIQVVKVLLKQGSLDVLQTNDKGQTALHLAGFYGRLECLKETHARICFVQRGKVEISHADDRNPYLQTDKKGYNVLHRVCKGPKSPEMNITVDTLRWLFQEMPHLDNPKIHNLRTEKEGYSMLLLACDNGNSGLVEYLLRDKAVDVCSTAEDGKTGLHLAAIHDYPDIAELLISHGISLTAQDREWKKKDSEKAFGGDTALHIAVRKSSEGVEQKIRSCAEKELEIKNKMGEVPDQVMREEIIPLEIKKLGEAKVQQYRKLLRKGKEKKMPRCNLIALGEQRVGKTSLLCLLMGKEFIKDRNSTFGINNEHVDVMTTSVNVSSETWMQVKPEDITKRNMDQFGDSVAEGFQSHFKSESISQLQPLYQSQKYLQKQLLK